jgi:hypothetical protein
LIQLYPAIFMEPGTTWVERGSDGHPYFVRKKLKLPSTRSLLADALAPKRRPLSLFRHPGKDFLTTSAPMSTPLSFPTRTTESSTSRSTTPVMLPPQPGSVMYPLPYPTLYLAPPQTSQEHRIPSVQQHPLDHTRQYQFVPFGMYSPGLTSSHYFAAQPLPPGAQALSPPRAIAADDSKYKCSVCRRFRSPRYHHSHPIPPGELPKDTACSRCRDAGTESEGSYESNQQAARYSRNKSRSRGRGRFSDDIEVRTLSARSKRRPTRRSPSRLLIVQRSPSRGRRVLLRSYNRSDSLDGELERLEITDERRRGVAQSPGVEVVERIRYINEAPPRPTWETVYIEERVPTRQISTHSEVHFDEDDLGLCARLVWYHKHQFRHTELLAEGVLSQGQQHL